MSRTCAPTSGERSSIARAVFGSGPPSTSRSARLEAGRGRPRTSALARAGR
jgi:hypothetical protein